MVFVFITSPSPRILTLNIDPNTTTLETLKLQIEQIYNIPISQQRLLEIPTTQSDSTLLSDLGIGPLSILTLYFPSFDGPKPRLGRLAATGFTTRSDIGPARAAPDFPDSYAAGRGIPEELKIQKFDGSDENKRFDEFERKDLASTEYYDEDKEFDAVWESIRQMMDSRRKDMTDPKITEQFANLKLYTVSSSEELDRIQEDDSWTRVSFDGKPMGDKK